MDPILPGTRHFNPAHINSALRASCSSSQSESNQRLIENCRRAGLRVNGHTPADGNCFFHAMSNQLSLLGLQDQSAAELRRGVVAFLRNNPQIKGPDGVIEFKSYIQSDWTTYLASMSRKSEWADAVVLVAMARMLKRDIMVVTSSPGGTNDNVIQWIVGDENFSGTPIRLGHIWEFHYESLDSTVAQLESTAAPITSSKESNSSSTTASHDPKLERQKRKRNTEELSNQEFEKVSDRDIKDIANKTCLAYADLHILFHALGMSYAAIENAERNANTRDVKLQAMKVLKEWQKKNGQDASRRRIINALFECNLILAKDILEETWGFITQGMEYISDSDIWDITSKTNLQHAHLQLVFHTLDLSRAEIEKAEMAAKTRDVNLQSMNVFRMWRMKNGRKASRQRIIDALIRCDLVEAKLILEKEWGLVTSDSDVEIPAKIARLTSTDEHDALPAAPSHDPAVRSLDHASTSHDPFGTSHDPAATSDNRNQRRQVKSVKDGKVTKWRQQLVELYWRSRREIRFGRRRFDVASIDELCVDLELNEEQFNPSDFVKKGRKLESYLELFSFSESHHILLFGKAGTGKTTQINKIAYDWASKVHASQSQNQCVQALCKIKLVLVLDIRKFKSNQTLAEAIKRQLLPSAAIGDIDEALEYLKQRCLLLLDGYDEIPKTLDDHALESPHLPHLFVIITSRPHMTDLVCRQLGKYTQVQVLGFSKENVPLYIQKFFKVMKKSGMAITLTQKVKETPLLQTLSSFPVLLVMICLLWENTHERDMTFHSMTSLYTEAVSKYLNKPFEGKNAKCLSQGQIKQAVILGKTGLSELFENIVQIDEKKFEDIDVLKLAIDMGLVVCAEGKLVDDTTVSFIHKTFQEYCAAVYLCGLFHENRLMFDSHLQKIIGDCIEQMEYLIRFCCGFDIDVAAVILVKVVQIIRWSHLGNLWKLPFVLIFETELSHGKDTVKKYQLHSKLCTHLDHSVSVYDTESLAAIMYFCNKHVIAKDTWLRKIQVLSFRLRVCNIQSLIQVLCGMVSLERVEIQITDELENGPITQDLKHVVLKELTFAGNVFERRVMSLRLLSSILNCTPTLKKISLIGLKLKGHLHVNSGNCKESLEELTISHSNTNMCSLQSILRSMPALTHLSLNGLCLSSDLKDISSASSEVGLCDHVILTASCKELQICAQKDSGCNCTPVDVVSLVNLINFMPSLKNVYLENVHLTGDMDGTFVTLSRSLKEFKISGASSTIMTLVGLLGCQAKSTDLSLSNVHLTKLNGIPNDKSLLKALLLDVCSGELKICGHQNTAVSLSRDIACVNVGLLVSLLHSVSPLTSVLLQKCELAGKFDRKHVMLSETLKEFVLLDCSVNIFSLERLQSCLPELTTVSLQQCQLRGTFDTVVLCEFREFLIMEPNDDVHKISIVGLLNRKSTLRKMIFEQCELIGEVDGNPDIEVESMTKFAMSGGSVTTSLLVGLLHCMPELTSVSLTHCNLTGELSESHVNLTKSQLTGELKRNPEISWESFRYFQMLNGSSNITALAGLIGCMPKAKILILSKIHLTDLDGTPDDESLLNVLDVCSGRLEVRGHHRYRTEAVSLSRGIACVNVELLVSLLHSVSPLTSVLLQKCELAGKFDRKHVMLSETLKEFVLLDCSVNIFSLERLQSCLPELTRVSLQRCQLTGEFDTSVLCELFMEFTYMEQLSGGYFNTTSIVSLLNRKSTLRKMSLQQCKLIGDVDGNPEIEVESMSKFAMSGGKVNISLLEGLLHCLPELTSVSLRHCNLTGDLSESHVNLCESLKSVKEFEIIGHGSVLYTENTTLIFSLLDHLVSLRALILRNLTTRTVSMIPWSKLSCLTKIVIIGADGASALTQSLQYTQALQHLDLRGNRVSSDEASALARAFQHTTSLQHLDLGKNSIGSYGAAALAQSFQHIPLLQHMDLSGNYICSYGASKLARSFQHIPALQHLDLSSNTIGCDGAAALAQSFQHTTALQYLNLSENSIGSDGAAALAQSFQYTPALQHLNLSRNKIGSDGAAALAQSFQHTPTLQYLT